MYWSVQLDLTIRQKYVHSETISLCLDFPQISPWYIDGYFICAKCVILSSLIEYNGQNEHKHDSRVFITFGTRMAFFVSANSNNEFSNMETYYIDVCNNFKTKHKRYIISFQVTLFKQNGVPTDNGIGKKIGS